MPASFSTVSGEAYRPKPMICSASCGNRVAIRCASASAVCFIGPQRPSAIIENERSTQRATDAEERRSVVRDVVLAPGALAQVLEHPAQRGLAEPAQRLRRQLQAVRSTHQPALP